MTNNTSVKFWNDLTETQSEAINGGIRYNFSIKNRQSNRIDDVTVVALGGENRSDASIGGFSITQSNNADNYLDVRF